MIYTFSVATRLSQPGGAVTRGVSVGRRQGTEPTSRGGYKAVSVGRGQGTEPTSRGGYKAGFSGEGAGD